MAAGILARSEGVIKGTGADRRFVKNALKICVLPPVSYKYFLLSYFRHIYESLSNQKFKNASSHAHPEDSHTISENPTSDSLLLKSLSKEFQQCASYEIL